MIKKEIKTKKYLINNDFDVIIGFHEFLHELNKSLVFKLSVKYELYGLTRLMHLFVKMKNEKKILNQAESMGLKKILIKNFIFTFGLEDIRYLELDEAIETILKSREGLTHLISDLS